MRVILTAYNRNQLRSESDQLDDSVENQPSPSHTTSENCVVEGDEEILPESETFEDKSLPESLVSAVTAHLKPAATVEATPRLKICDEAKVTLSTSEEPEQKLPATKSDIGTRKRKLSQGAPVDSLQANQKKPAAIDPVDSKKPAAKMTAGRYPDEEREPPPPADENTISVVEKNDANVFADRALPSRDDFTKILKQRGLEIRQQEGDGNCLFRAVSFQVYGDANMHMDVRQQCLDHMAKDEAHFAHFVEDEDFSAYIKRKRQEGVHGNNPEIQAISELFNRPVEVFTPDNGASPLNIFQADYKTSELPIRLSYAESHYNAVVDPLLPTAGLGLGLPGLQPGLADKMQMDKAVRESDQLADNAELKKAMEDSHNDQLQRAIKESSLSNDQMYSNKAMALSDLEATSLDIEQAILESSLDAFRQQESGRKQGAADSRTRREPAASLSSNVAKIPPAAAPSAAAAAVPRVASVAAAASVPMMMEPQVAVASRTAISTDEYPPTVQELVMNGFELSKVVHAYELIGDDFDNLLSFLVSINT